MKKIFPSEIINHSAEMHFYKHSKPFQLIYLSIVILLIILIGILPLITVEITTQSRGIIRTPIESSQIQSSIAGLVAYSNLGDGKLVHMGDTLLKLVDEPLLEQIILAKKQLSENDVFINDLSSLIIGKQTVRSNRYNLELTQYSANINEMKIAIDILKKEYDMADQLYNELVIAEMEYLQTKNKYESAVSKLDVYKKQIQNSWQTEKTRLELENIQLQSSVKRLQKESTQYVITAPITGSIGQLAGIQEGSFITPGQQLAVISPEDALIAECYVSPVDIGFIRNKQEVRIQLDAFNYNQWGLIHGKVMSVSDDIIVINNSPVFKVRCQLPVNYLQLKTGQKGHLKKGMSLTGRFILTERTLYQLLFDKVDDWLNPNLVSNNKLMANN
ncbi:HlyD family secretion protein [Carboxylicivirga linearis]|uniref:HlyD family efflux transporter periplasmic adaptor subunit n=1 Tax=Carboxylicivirga linearis TaxID=1628157 RepID=A0ABS5JPP0_9BACT|nr:HlyD family efflux transporter periplasmic adaptor subunit [Carboxylicivirga linearis]MBS2096789.1 HlyD family efflux transporter periplasmic adaptor subunit [Carboxylicivirga linearis]